MLVNLDAPRTAHRPAFEQTGRWLVPKLRFDSGRQVFDCYFCKSGGATQI